MYKLSHMQDYHYDQRILIMHDNTIETGVLNIYEAIGCPPEVAVSWNISTF